MNKRKGNCFKCQHEVLMYKPYQESKWVLEELDETPHQCSADPNYAAKQQQPQPAAATPPSQQTLRTDAIAIAHEENLESAKQTRDSVDSLTTEIRSMRESINLLNTTMLLISGYIRDFLKEQGKI